MSTIFLCDALLFLWLFSTLSDESLIIPFVVLVLFKLIIDADCFIFRLAVDACYKYCVYYSSTLLWFYLMDSGYLGFWK